MLEHLAASLSFNPPFPPSLGPGVSRPPQSADVLERLGNLPSFPAEVHITRSATIQLPDGLDLFRIRYNVGYGSDTEAVVLRPSGAKGPLPSVLVLHSHDDVKKFGKEKVVEGAGELDSEVEWVRSVHYGSRAPAVVAVRS